MRLSRIGCFASARFVSEAEVRSNPRQQKRPGQNPGLFRSASSRFTGAE
jgi:hypothetical protein